MKNVFKIIIGLAMLVVCGCKLSQAPAAEYTVRDLGNLSKGDPIGSITVEAFLAYEEENHNLFASEAAYNNWATGPDCFAIRSTVAQSRQLEQLHGSWVIVTGQILKDVCGPNTFCPDSCTRSALKIESVSAQ